MSALPFRLTGDEALLADATPPGETPAAIPPRPSGATDIRRSAEPALPTAAGPELTARALGVGLAIGAVLAAGNVYTGLKSSFIDGGALTAALLSFTFFATFKRLLRVPFGPLETNVAQTAAASAAVMTYVHGLMGPMPALMMMGQRHPAWALWVWGLALAIIGLAIGVMLRRKLVVDDALPFPTGTATAELIKTVHADRGSAARRTHLLVAAALAAAALTWFRDGRPSLLPQAAYLPLTIAGLTASSLTLGVATSPLMAATGMFIGLRGAASLLLGGMAAWAVIAPLVVSGAWSKDTSYGGLTAWLVWPALGMMMASTLVPLLLDWRKLGAGLRRIFRDASAVSMEPVAAKSASPGGGHGGFAWGARIASGAVVALAAAVLTWTGSHVFGVSPLLTLAVLVASVVLAGICARAAGETDVAPIGPVGTLTQILFAGGGSSGSIVSGAVVAGSASATASALWAFKAGHTLRASVRSQIVAQALGAVVGSIVVVPVYLLVTQAYPLGSERMPAVAALSWKATAEAMAGGLGGLPAHAAQAAAISFVVGVVLCLLHRTKAARLLPAPMAIGIGMIMPVSLSAAAVLGAGAMVLFRRRVPSFLEGDGNVVAAGLLAGESIVGVLIAVLVSAGLLTF